MSSLAELILQQAPMNIVYIDVSKEDKWRPVGDKIEALGNLQDFMTDGDLTLKGMKYFAVFGCVNYSLRKKRKNEYFRAGNFNVEV